MTNGQDAYLCYAIDPGSLLPLGRHGYYRAHTIKNIVFSVDILRFYLDSPRQPRNQTAIYAKGRHLHQRQTEWATGLCAVRNQSDTRAVLSINN